MNLNDLKGDDQGEVGEFALSFHFDEAGDIVPDGWKRAENEEFTPEELAEAYVLASRELISKQDAAAGQTLTSFLSQAVDENGMKVFSMWSEDISLDKPREHDVNCKCAQTNKEESKNTENSPKKSETITHVYARRVKRDAKQAKPEKPVHWNESKTSYRSLKRMTRQRKAYMKTEEFKRSRPNERS